MARNISVEAALAEYEDQDVLEECSSLRGSKPIYNFGSKQFKRKKHEKALREKDNQKTVHVIRSLTDDCKHGLLSVDEAVKQISGLEATKRRGLTYLSPTATRRLGAKCIESSFSDIGSYEDFNTLVKERVHGMGDLNSPIDVYIGRVAILKNGGIADGTSPRYFINIGLARSSREKIMSERERLFEDIVPDRVFFDSYLPHLSLFTTSNEAVAQEAQEYLNDTLAPMQVIKLNRITALNTSVPNNSELV